MGPYKYGLYWGHAIIYIPVSTCGANYCAIFCIWPWGHHDTNQLMIHPNSWYPQTDFLQKGMHKVFLVLPKALPLTCYNHKGAHTSGPPGTTVLGLHKDLKLTNIDMFRGFLGLPAQNKNESWNKTDCWNVLQIVDRKSVPPSNGDIQRQSALQQSYRQIQAFWRKKTF